MVWVGPLLADSLYVPPVSFGTTFWSPASLLADALQLVPLYSFSAIGSSIPSILQTSLHSIFLLPVPLYLLPTVSLSTAVGSIFLTINQLLRSAYSAYPFSAPRSFAAAPLNRGRALPVPILPVPILPTLMFRTLMLLAPMLPAHICVASTLHLSIPSTSA